jgi:hypothetical protein
MAAKGYWREISAILVFKVVGLALLYFLFVAPALTPPVNPADAARHLTAGQGAPMAAP